MIDFMYLVMHALQFHLDAINIMRMANVLAVKIVLLYNQMAPAKLFNKLS